MAMKRALQFIVLVPLALVCLALAVANRGNVVVSFDPFSSDTAAQIQAPLFVVLILAIAFGVVVGGSGDLARAGQTPPRFARPQGRGCTGARRGEPHEDLTVTANRKSDPSPANQSTLATLAPICKTRAWPSPSKSAGFRRPHSVEAALAAGADMVGFVRFEKSPRHVSLEAAQKPRAPGWRDGRARFC